MGNCALSHQHSARDHVDIETRLPSFPRLFHSKMPLIWSKPFEEILNSYKGDWRDAKSAAERSTVIDAVANLVNIRVAEDEGEAAVPDNLDQVRLSAHSSSAYQIAIALENQELDGQSCS